MHCVGNLLKWRIQKSGARIASMQSIRFQGLPSRTNKIGIFVVLMLHVGFWIMLNHRAKIPPVRLEQNELMLVPISLPALQSPAVKLDSIDTGKKLKLHRATKSAPSDIAPQTTSSMNDEMAMRDRRSTIESRPYLDLDALKRLARKNAHEPEKKQLQGVRPSIAESEKFAHAIADASRPDCRSAHADAGLLAPILMLKDALSNSGCKW